MAAITLFNTPETYPILEREFVQFGQYKIEFKAITEGFKKYPAEKAVALGELFKVHVRSLIAHTFELIKDYCNETGQDTIFRAQNWYQFARLEIACRITIDLNSIVET